MKAHASENRLRRELAEEQKNKLHPMQIEMLCEPIHFGRFGTLLKTDSDNPSEWTVERDERDTCSYCGSITIDDAIKAFETPGVEWSGCDWKYGFPHKLYIEFPCEPYERYVGGEWIDGKLTRRFGTASTRHHKFYTTHMEDATTEQVGAWNSKVAPVCGISFTIEDGGLKWHAIPGHQGYGMIGEPVKLDTP